MRRDMVDGAPATENAHAGAIDISGAVRHINKIYLLTVPVHEPEIYLMDIRRAAAYIHPLKLKALHISVRDVPLSKLIYRRQEIGIYGIVPGIVKLPMRYDRLAAALIPPDLPEVQMCIRDRYYYTPYGLKLQIRTS